MLKLILLSMFLLFSVQSFSSYPIKVQEWADHMTDSGLMTIDEVDIVFNIAKNNLHMTEDQLAHKMNLAILQHRRSLSLSESTTVTRDRFRIGAPIPPHIKLSAKALLEALRPAVAEAPTEGPGMNRPGPGAHGNEGGHRPRPGGSGGSTGSSGGGGGGGGGPYRPIM